MESKEVIDDLATRRPLTYSLRISRFIVKLFKEPVFWIRENVVEPNRGPKYYWYHRKYGRAVPIDECYVDDVACIHEANQEFARNRLVDRATLDLLRFRAESCSFWHAADQQQVGPSEACQDLIDTFDREKLNYTIKYGEMMHNLNAHFALNKQKHRMIMDRRRAEKAKETQEAEVGSS